MIPQRLVMSAFGSYAGREEIDFSEAGPGIFLVTGDTARGRPPFLTPSPMLSMTRQAGAGGRAG